jgi:hypothetical protein
MDLQTLSGKPVSSRNACLAENFRPYSPQTSDVRGGQPDTHGHVDFPIDGVNGVQEPPNPLGHRTFVLHRCLNQVSIVGPREPLRTRLQLHEIQASRVQ